MSDVAAADTATEATTDTTVIIETDSDTLTLEQVQAEAEKYKALARKHEDRAKANAAAAKELEQVRAASMSEQERAVAEAVDKAKQETRIEFGGVLVAAEVKVASAGRLDAEQVAELLDTVDLAKFLTEDGEVDSERIKAFVERIAPKPTENDEIQIPDLGQGNRGSTPALGSDPLLQALKNTVGAR